MRIKFCGAAQTVTGSSHLLTLNNGYTILLDCGLYQGVEDKFEDFNLNWNFKPSEIDCVILSHAHIDHSGRLPQLVKDGFTGPIYSTGATCDLCAIMLMDSAYIQMRDAEFVNKRKDERNNGKLQRPLYTPKDVAPCMNAFTTFGYNKWKQIADGVELQFRDSGHILGSASVTLRIKKNEYKTVSFGFTGDIGRPERPILRDPVPMPQCDYLICESTYGGRSHENHPDEKVKLLRIIRETCIEKGGKLLIPAFSVGRTQEIVYLLDQLENEGKLPRIPVYVDSPLAINATDIFQWHPECFDDEILEYMITDSNPFGFKDLQYIRPVARSKKLNESNEPCIIISASGMITAGRIKHHVLNNIENPKTTILIVGYAPPHTIGGQLRAGADRVKIFGALKKVNATIEVMDSFSAHGDQAEMLDYLDNQNRKKLKQIFLVHGDYQRQKMFKKGLKEAGFGKIAIPRLKDEYHFEQN